MESLKINRICVINEAMKEKTIARTAYIIVRRCPYDQISLLTVAEIALRLNVSTSYLCRCFRKYYKFTLGSHINYYLKVRFIFLANSMEAPTLKGAIARMKIKDVNYFIKRFKKDFFWTPGAVIKGLLFARMKRAEYEQKKQLELLQDR